MKAKTEYFEAIREYLEREAAAKDLVELTEGLTIEETLAFLTKQIDQLKGQAEKAARRRESKAAESEELTGIIYEAIMVAGKLITAEEIVQNVSIENLTTRGVAARVGKLVQNGRVVKEYIKTEDGKKRIAYRVND